MAVTEQASEKLHLSTSRVRFRKVLVATDFSRYSHVALKVGASLARSFGASLVTVHCVSPMAYTVGFDSVSPELVETGIANARAFMNDELESGAGVSGLEHEERVEVGAPVDVINELIAELNVDLVVCASHGATGVEKAVMGSGAESIVRRAACPVLVIGPNCVSQSFDGSSILFCTNLSKNSYRPAQYAAALAEEMNGRLTVLHVAPPLAVEEAEDVVRQRLCTQLKELMPEDLENWCHLKTCVVFGDADESILPVAARERADLIVMGVKEEGVLADHLPWGTLTTVIRGATCPVLAVRGHYRNRKR